MSKTILITRARGDEEELTDALHDLGMHVIHEPLTEITLLHTARPEVEYAVDNHPDAMLVTSRHGVRGLATLTPFRDLPLLCVGNATVEAAYSLGFTRATATGQTADDMVEHILAAYDEGSYFVYVSAQHIRNDITAILSQHGMIAERVVVYEAAAVDSFSDVLQEHFRNEHIDAVTFLSQRAATIFMDLIQAAHLQDSLKHMKACCMSNIIAEALPNDIWGEICAAEQPTLASVAHCVDNALR